jgi:hypothetical protein
VRGSLKPLPGNGFDLRRVSGTGKKAGGKINAEPVDLGNLMPGIVREFWLSKKSDPWASGRNHVGAQALSVAMLGEVCRRCHAWRCQAWAAGLLLCHRVFRMIQCRDAWSYANSLTRSIGRCGDHPGIVLTPPSTKRTLS